MKRMLFILFCVVIFHFSGSGQRSGRAEISVISMKISFQVIPEDYETHLYYVEWEDTLGQAEGYEGDKRIKRPKELRCVITNQHNDTLGYYLGLSTAQTFAMFQSRDSLVNLNFMVGLNLFTDKFESAQNKGEYQKAAGEFSRDHHLPVVFKPISINLNSDLRKKFTLELIAQ